RTAASARGKYDRVPGTQRHTGQVLSQQVSREADRFSRRKYLPRRSFVEPFEFAASLRSVYLVRSGEVCSSELTLRWALTLPVLPACARTPKVQHGRKSSNVERNLHIQH